ncbi:MAG TPA: hypothetical protein VE821_08355 [Pyrinomonadaceae bacterium]|nr:hypothetical protein [Pyrinomonadaceae bacterium]
MIERTGGARLLNKTVHAPLVRRNRRQQKLERDRPMQLHVERTIDFAHPARAEQGADFVAT